ncbi:MAG: hypothetical protein K9L56_14765 [Clostridiales bacterium]|nr:hypothetical protein [Clostridiales bacterium]
MNILADLIEVTPVNGRQTDNIVASIMANREEGNDSHCFQFMEIPGLKIECGMVLVCDTGRYTIVDIKKINGGYLRVQVQKV